jgi:hypothetical protein
MRTSLSRRLLLGVLGVIGVLASIPFAIAKGGECGTVSTSHGLGEGRPEERRVSSRMRYMPARDVIGAASASHQPRTGEAAALPLPRRAQAPHALHVVVLFYREGMRPGEEIVFPPHRMVSVDPVTGSIVESRPSSPAALGVARSPGVPQRGFGLDPAMTASEFWQRTDRFMELSAAVWELYDDGATLLDPVSRGVVAEYDACFRSISKQPLMPYYEAIAKDFFQWLGRVLGRDSRP